MSYIAILISLVCLTTSIHLQLQDGNHIVFNSSMNRGVISVSATSTGQIGSSFQIQSQILSPLMNRHKFIHKEDKLEFQPQLKQELIFSNDKYQDEYWLTLKHKVIKHESSKIGEVRFVGLKVIDQGQPYNYLLPTFQLPFSFLAFGTFYSCDNVIASITVRKYAVDIALFAKMSDKVSWIQEQGRWNWNWRKNSNDYDFGRYTTKQKQKHIKITLSNDKYCSFDPVSLESADNSKMPQNRYLDFDTVFKHSTALEVRSHHPEIQKQTAVEKDKEQL